MLPEVGYPPPILGILADGFVVFLHIIENLYLNYSLHITHFSSNWLFYKTEQYMPPPFICSLRTYLLITYLLAYLLTYSLTYYSLTYLLSLLFTYLLSYLLTPWSKVLEKLTDFHLVTKFLTSYGTRMFITEFTSARHLSLS